MISTLQTIALVVLAVSTVGLLLIFWCAITAPVDRDEDGEESQRAVDSIRAELARQEAPSRPNIRGLS